MKATSLFKVQSLVAMVLFTALAADASLNQQQQQERVNGNTVATTPGSDSLSQLLSLANQNQNPCESQASRVDTLMTAQQTAAQNALQNQQQNETTQLDYRQKAQQDAAQQIDAADAYQLAVSAITDKLTIDKQKAQSNTAKALADLRSKVIEMNEKVNEAKNTLQQASDAIDNAATDRESSCRGIAETAGNTEDQKIQAKQTALDAAVANHTAFSNNEMSSLSGATNRRKARRVMNVQNAYLTAYKNCMSGTTGAGAAAQGAMDKAKRAFASAQLDFNNKMTTYTQGMAELKQAMAQAQQDGVIAMNEAQAAATANLNAAQATYNSKVRGLTLDAQQNLEKAALANQQSTVRQLATQTSMQQANAELQKATYASDLCAYTAAANNKQLQAALKANCNSPQRDEYSNGRCIDGNADNSNLPATASPGTRRGNADGT